MLEEASRFGLTADALHFDQLEIERQTTRFANSVSFIGAMRSALRAITTQHSDPESILAQLLADSSYELQIPYTDLSSDQLIKHSQAKLKEHFANPSTIFSLVSENCSAPVFPAEHGECLSDNWIFFLSIPSYSDHLFWAIVDRRGEVPSYTYGFN